MQLLCLPQLAPVLQTIRTMWWKGFSSVQVLAVTVLVYKMQTFLALICSMLIRFVTITKHTTGASRQLLLCLLKCIDLITGLSVARKVDLPLWMPQDRIPTPNYVPRIPFLAATVHPLKILFVMTRLKLETQCVQSLNLNSTKLAKAQPFQMRANWTSLETWLLVSVKTMTHYQLPKLKWKASPALIQLSSSKHLPTSWRSNKKVFANLIRTSQYVWVQVTALLAMDGARMNSRCKMTTESVKYF